MHESTQQVDGDIFVLPHKMVGYRLIADLALVNCSIELVTLAVIPLVTTARSPWMESLLDAVTSAQRFAERIRRIVASYPICHGQEQFHLTISLGVAVADKNTRCINELIEDADRRFGSIGRRVGSAAGIL